jgi:uncharacterized protein YdeI (YjbR/CyaY-like superfamily)
MRDFAPKTLPQWREWLKANHGTEDGVWLVFPRKHAGSQVLDYEMALEEALCFGWIDGLIKKLDEDHYARKFTPRRPGSKWSELNKQRIERLIASGRMRPEGEAVISAARIDGSWDKPDRPPVMEEVPQEFQQALQKNPRARATFEALAPSYRKHYLLWVGTAKRPETRQKRILEAIRLLEAGEKLGLK